ncbi:MAG: hypothetical protein ABR600_13075 [Actinomycetota bacterium]
MEMTSRDRKSLIVLGSVALVALVLFMFVLRKGGGSTETAAPADTGVTAGTGTVVQPTPTPSPSESPKAELNHVAFNGRDPFEPLVAVDGEASTGGSTTGTGTTTTTTTDTTGSTAATAATPTPTPVESPAPAPSPSTAATDQDPATILHAGHRVTLVGFATENGSQVVKLTVDDKAYTVKIGQDVVDGFKLLSVREPCADFRHVTHPFTLCVT